MLNYSISLYKNAYSGLSRAVWWLSLVMLVNRAGTMVYPFLTVYLRDKFSFSVTDAGWEVALFGIGAILGNFLGGKITDKFGFYQLQFWSLFLNGVLLIALGYFQTFWQIGGCLFITGIVGEAFRPANAAAIAYYSAPENRTRSYSLNRLAINVGFSIGPAIAGLLAFEYLFWIDGCTCMIAAVILRLALNQPASIKHQEKGTVKEKTISVWKDRTYLRFMFFVFLAALCFLQMFSMLPLYYKEQIHFSKPLVGLILAMNGLVIAIFEMILVYKLEGRRSMMQYISIGAFFIGVSYALLNLPVQGLLVAVMAMLTITMGEMLMFPFVNTFWTSRSHAGNRGQYASVYSMAFACAHVLAPTFGSQVVRYSSYQILWYVVFGLCTIAAIGFYTFKKHDNG